MKNKTSRRNLNVLLQTGPLTPPDSLIWDLQTNGDISVDVRRLGTSFRVGGVAAFIRITTADIEALADILHRHTKRLKTRGVDDLALLVGGTIDTDEEVVGFRNVRFQRQVSLKGKSEDEIRGILEQGGL